MLLHGSRLGVVVRGVSDMTNLVACHGGDHVVVRLPDTSFLKDLTAFGHKCFSKAINIVDWVQDCTA